MRGKTGFALAGGVFLLDQFTKWLVAGPIGLTELGQNIHLLPFFDLTRVHNYGISLGLLTAGSDTARWALVAAADRRGPAEHPFPLHERLGNLVEEA